MISFRTLGAVDLRDDHGRELRNVLRQPKRIALLAYLAAATPRRFHRRDTLVGLFWPELDEQHARGALRQSVRFLRRALGEDAVVSRGDQEVALAEHIVCDAADFERGIEQSRLQDALDIYRGDFLPGFYVSNAAPEFDEWLDGERVRLRSLAAQAAWELAEREELAGNIAAGVLWARRAISVSPHDEPATRRLIGMLDRSGDRAGAIRAYQDLAQKLAAEYQAEPAAETEALIATVRQRTPAKGMTQRSIAVLPFVNMSPDPENEFFSDGVTEELVTVLTKIGSFRVPARTSCFAYKHKDIDVREIGRRLGVDMVLEGSVRKAGDRVRITSQLIQVDDGCHLWSESYDREIRDIFAVQNDIALRIVEALNVKLTDRERRNIRRAPTQSVRAYEYYLKGRQFFYHHRRKSYALARDLFVDAIGIDPAYALAYAGVADCCSFLHMYVERTEANLTEANRASSRALEIDPELAEAHASRGLALSLTQKFTDAEREYERAIELDSTLFEAYYFYARACWAQGKLEKAEELFRKAVCARPEDYQSAVLLAGVYCGLGRSDEEIAAGRRALEVIRRHLEFYPDDVRARYLGASMLILLGDREQGRAWLEKSLETDDPSVYYNVACGFMKLDEPERALDCLARAVDAGFAHRAWAENDSDFLPLRTSPRFLAILDRMSSQDTALVT